MINICSKILEKSKDLLFFESLCSFINICESNGIHPLVIGSCALLSHAPFIYRIPGDLDIVISSAKFKVLRNIQEFNVCSCSGFCEIEFNRIKVHIIIDNFDLINKTSNEVVGTVSFNDIIEHFTCCNKLSFMSCFATNSIELMVPKIEISFLLSLLKPINTNTIHDTIHLIENYTLEINIMVSFLKENYAISDIFFHRINEIAQILNDVLQSEILVFNRLINIYDELYHGVCRGSK